MMTRPEKILLSIAAAAIILYLESRGIEALIERQVRKRGWKTR